LASVRHQFTINASSARHNFVIREKGKRGKREKGNKKKGKKEKNEKRKKEKEKKGKGET